MRTGQVKDTDLASFSTRKYSASPSLPYTRPASLYTAAQPSRSMSRPTDLPLTSHPGSKRGFKYGAATYEFGRLRIECK